MLNSKYANEAGRTRRKTGDFLLAKRGHWANLPA
jgi:hypothetical protein